MSDYSGISAIAEVQFSKKKAEMEEKGTRLSEVEEAALYTQFVELQLLKAPASAVFPPLDEMFVQKNEDGTYKVSGFVDAQNSYGTMLRTQFSYDVGKVDGKWNCLETFVDSDEQRRQQIREETKEDMAQMQQQINSSMTSNTILWWVLGIIGSIISAIIFFAQFGDLF